jgi:ParB-like chromosome segregation protein Spo0J
MHSLLDQIERVSIMSLQLYPGNPNEGDIPSIAESLDENGQVLPVVVEKGTRRILSGNHTVIAAAGLGWTEIDAVFVDVTEDRGRRILLALNRTRDKARTNNDALAEFLSYLDDDYSGTGYTEYDVERLLDVSALDPQGVITVDPELAEMAATAQPATQQRGHLCPKCGYDVRSDPEGFRL